MSVKETRVRFAPSPTGPLHMGGVRTALYNYLFAKKHHGKFILRIEDTDQTRYVDGAENYIIESLKWSGLAIAERKHLYKQYADLLIEKGHAYYAFDSAEDLEKMREMAKKAKMPNWQYNSITRNSMKNSLTLPEDEIKGKIKNGDPHTIRIKMPRNHDVRFYDEIRALGGQGPPLREQGRNQVVAADRILAISGWRRQRRPLTLRAAISSSLLPIWETTDQRSRLPASEYPVKGTG